MTQEPTGGKELLRSWLHSEFADLSVQAPVLLWDGEWEVTWVTFRDMGGAFMVAQSSGWRPVCSATSMESVIM